MTSDKELDLRVRALESLLIEKGLVEEPAIEEIIDLFENRMGPHNGAKVFVRAWNDTAFKSRLLDNASDAIVEMGYEAVQGEDMVVVENTPEVHNLVVCTLCSCFPNLTPPIRSEAFSLFASSRPISLLAPIEDRM